MWYKPPKISVLSHNFTKHVCRGASKSWWVYLSGSACGRTLGRRLVWLVTISTQLGIICKRPTCNGWQVSVCCISHDCNSRWSAMSVQRIWQWGHWRTTGNCSIGLDLGISGRPPPPLWRPQSTTYTSQRRTGHWGAQSMCVRYGQRARQTYRFTSCTSIWGTQLWFWRIATAPILSSTGVTCFLPK